MYKQSSLVSDERKVFWILFFQFLSISSILYRSCTDLREYKSTSICAIYIFHFICIFYFKLSTKCIEKYVVEIWFSSLCSYIFIIFYFYFVSSHFFLPKRVAHNHKYIHCHDIELSRIQWFTTIEKENKKKNTTFLWKSKGTRKKIHITQ